MIQIHIQDSTTPAMLRAIRAACDVLLGEMTHTGLTTQAAEHNSRAVQLHAAAEAESDKAAQCLTLHSKVQAFPNMENDRRFWVMGDETVRISELSEAERERLEPECVRRGIAMTLASAKPAESLTAAFDKSVETAGAPAVGAGILAEQAEDLDSAGQPWSAELHSSSRAKIADGTWKKRRGAAVAPPATGFVARDDAGEPVPAPAAPPVPPAPTAPLVTMNDIYALVTSGKRTINDVIALAQEVGFADVGAFSRDATPEQRAQLLAQLTKEVA